MIPNRCEINCIYKIYDMKNLGTFCDIILVSDNVKIKAHKLILSSSSDYFKAMLGGNFKEANMQEITIYGIDYNTLQTLIEYMYTGILNITESNVELLLMKADYLQIKTAVTLCENFLLKKITIYNCIKMYNYAKEYNRYDLSNSILDFIIGNIMDIVNNPMFKQLSYSTVYDILKSDNLNVYDEDLVINILLKWLNYTSNICTTKLLKCIRLSLVSDNAFKILQQHPLVNENLKCVKLLLSVKHRNLIPRINTIDSVIALGTKKFSLLKVPLNSSLTKKWSIETFLPVHRQNFSVAILDLNIYIAGGTINGFATNIVSCYDTINKTWKDVTSLKTPRYCTSMVVYKNRLVIIGGKNNFQNYLNDVESWHPGKTTWTKLPNLNNESFDISSVVVDDRIFNIGGVKHCKNRYKIKSKCINTVETLTRYGWIERSSLFEPRAGMLVASYENFIYATGGYMLNTTNNNKIFDRSTNLYKYNIMTDTWSLITPLNMVKTNNINNLEYNENNKKIYIVGGFTNNKNFSTVEQYNINKHEWENITLNFFNV
ncbi:BTB kelch-domain protein [Hypsugopox virus]|nr:BTB kelch-domain protein [Hypsugopox virus]